MHVLHGALFTSPVCMGFVLRLLLFAQIYDSKAKQYPTGEVIVVFFHTNYEIALMQQWIPFFALLCYAILYTFALLWCVVICEYVPNLINIIYQTCGLHRFPPLVVPDYRERS